VAVAVAVGQLLALLLVLVVTEAAVLAEYRYQALRGLLTQVAGVVLGTQVVALDMVEAVQVVT